MSNWGTEIASMSHVIFEHIKGKDNSLADIISCLRSIHLYDSLDPEVDWNKLEHNSFKELPPINAEHPTQLEQNETLIHEIQHVSKKFNQEEIRTLQERDPHYVELIEYMKMRNEVSKGDYSLDIELDEVLNIVCTTYNFFANDQNVQGHEPAFFCLCSKETYIHLH